MQFTLGMKGVCSSPASVEVKLYDIYKPVLITFKEFF